MSEQDLTGSKRFGNYLRRLREGRKLSLDAVVEMSTEFPEKLTKSHLSRMENGQALPSFPRLYALSRIYGVPTSSLAEQFELDLELELQPPGLESLSDEEMKERAKNLILSGRYSEALRLCQAACERAVEEGRSTAPTVIDLRIYILDCLDHRGLYLLGKEKSEELLNSSGLSSPQRLFALHFFILCCKNLGRLVIARMALEEAERECASHEAPARFRADIEIERGSILAISGDWNLAAEAFQNAAQLYEELPKPLEACRARVNLAQALMNLDRTDEARNVLVAAIKEAEENGYDRLQALGLSHLCVLAYRMGLLVEAETYALRSNALARPRDYLNLVFRNCFYLWQIARARKDDAVVRLNERSLRTYAGRVDETLPEAQEFRAYLAGGEA